MLLYELKIALCPVKGLQVGKVVHDYEYFGPSVVTIADRLELRLTGGLPYSQLAVAISCFDIDYPKIHPDSGYVCLWIGIVGQLKGEGCLSCLLCPDHDAVEELAEVSRAVRKELDLRGRRR
jgi:hypothetical protein